MPSLKLRLALLGGVFLLGLWLAGQGGKWLAQPDSPAQAPVGPEGKSASPQPAKPVGTALAEALAKAGEPEPAPPGDDRSLEQRLAEYEVEGDIDLLDKLQAEFPQHPKIALAAYSAEAEPNPAWLALLERAEPGNALPHLLRAALWAEADKGEEMMAELRRALAKPSLTTHLRERQVEALRLILSKEDDSGLDVPAGSELDEGYIDAMDQIRDFLVEHPQMLGRGRRSGGHGPQAHGKAAPNGILRAQPRHIPG